ncbi:MAG: OmpA/MotB family protein, partial [Planctomycetota bacterium]
MKNRLLLLTLALAALPACQSQYEEIVEDQDRQLEAMQAERQRLLTERDRVRAENAALQEQLTLEQMRARELDDRIRAMEVMPAPQEPDTEVDNLRGRLEGHGISVERRSGFIVLDLPSAITFPSGKADLNAKGRRSLEAVVEVLQTDYSSKTFWVEGHTDNDPISKSGWKSNLHLSVMRAMAVADFLTKELAIGADQIRVAGHGEFAPKVENMSPENK